MVSDDKLTAALAEFRERQEKRVDFSRHIEATFVREAAETDVRRLLAVLDAVLKLHHPEGWIEWEHACVAHADARNHMQMPPEDCPDCRFIEGTGCGAEACLGGGAAWPCPTVQAITRELTGEGDDGR